MNDIKQVLEDLPLPAWVLPVVLAIFFLGTLSPGLKALWSVLKGVRSLFQRRKGTGAPRVSRDDRRAFAKDVASRLETLNTRDRWSDERYAELEAEIETEGTRVSSNALRRFVTGPPELRRERSLSEALANGRHRLVLLQGEPGSGKSVALRHLALAEANAAADARRGDRPIPLYINLKNLKRAQGQEIDAQLIEDFVLSGLVSGRTSDVKAFIEQTFLPGVKAGDWLFLFDAFDEIPDLLDATEVDETILAYSDAIREFLSGLRKCRGIVASRYFRAPEGLGWPEWRILPLAPERQLDLVESSGISKAKARELIDNLQTAHPEVRRMAANPLFLALLCEYVRQERQLPKDTHTVFEDFLDTRLQRDRERIAEITKLDVAVVRRVAEQVAFAMCAVDGLGLAPYVSDLVQAVRSGSGLGVDTIEQGMEALTIARLAVIEDDDHGDRTFDFIHRRFTEYFATRVVLWSGDVVRPRQLLTDMRWRETGVTILQLQPASASALLEEAQRLLAEGASRLPALDERAQDALLRGEYARMRRVTLGHAFQWPPHVLHVLDVLQSGVGAADPGMPQAVRDCAADLLSHAFAAGQIHDQRWALEVAAVADRATFTGMVRAAFRASSRWLREAAYQQVGRLDDVPPDIAEAIRRGLIRMSADGSLRRDTLTVRAQLQRLPDPARWLAALRLLRVSRWIDLALHLVAVAVLAALVGDSAEAGFLVAATALMLVSHSLFLLIMYSEPAIGEPRAGTMLLRLSPAATMNLLLALRAAIVAVLSIWLGARVDLLEQVAWTLLAAYAVTWGPGALRCVSQGRRLHPAGWLLSQEALAHDVSVRESVGSFGTFGLGIGAIFAGTILLGNLIEPLFRFIPGWITSALDFVFSGLSYLSYAMFGLFVLVLLLAGVLSLSDYARDLWWYVQWRRRRKDPLTGEALLQSLDAQQTTAGGIRLISDVRTERLLERTHDAIAVVDDLARATQQMIDGARIADLESAAWRSTTFAAWLQQDVPERLKRLQALDGEFLDELGRLLRDLEATAPQPDRARALHGPAA